VASTHNAPAESLMECCDNSKTGHAQSYSTMMQCRVAVLPEHQTRPRVNANYTIREQTDKKVCSQLTGSCLLAVLVFLQAKWSFLSAVLLIGLHDSLPCLVRALVSFLRSATLK